MTFDNSRFTFNPLRDYSGVVMEQGRPQTDADWNEWLAELNRRIQAGTLDILGRAVYPATTPAAFQITATTTPTLMIGPGRMYVDGLLAENHGDLTAAVWDPALAEMSDAPQPPFSAATPPTGSIDYTKQPHPPSTALPAGTGPFLAYLDVWTRPVTWLEDSNLIDKAIGVDSSGRLQTAWQVKLLPVPSGTTCSSLSDWLPPSSSGLLSTTTTPSTPSGPCCITDSSGYTGMENQFYRVEIQQPGPAAAASAPLPFTYPLSGLATFKWSRDNGSVMTGVTAINTVTNSAGNPASQLTVLSLGRDQTLGFSPGDWIEIIDDTVEFTDLASGFPGPGELALVDTVDPSGLTITLTGTLATTFPSDPTTTYTRIVRWGQSGKVYQTDGTKLTNLWIDMGANGSTGDIPVPPPGTMLVLENGVTVSFDANPAGGNFLTGDFWTFAARTADGSVEPLTKAPPRGIHHHYTPLSIVDFSTGSASDCRTKWPPSSGPGTECGCCCTYTVGVGGDYSSIQSAIQALPTSGGEICILPGIYYENIFLDGWSDVVIHGCGAQTRIASASLNPANVPSGGGSGIGTPTPFAAVITISGSQHIKLCDFCVEAADQEVGILLDGAGTLGVNSSGGGISEVGVAAADFAAEEDALVIDTTIEDLVITASTMPAILAQDAYLLRIDRNRIAMENVPSQWPAVWVSGREIHIDENWVGIQTAGTLAEWIPASVAGDLDAEQNPSSATAAAATSTSAHASASSSAATGASTSTKNSAKSAARSAPAASTKASPKTSAKIGPKAASKTSAKLSQPDIAVDEVVVSTGSAIHPGGIQIAGPARDVYVVENEIEGGAWNGITLGSFTTLDSNGGVTGQPIGVTVSTPGPCDSTVGWQTQTTTTGTQTGTTIVSSGVLVNIEIECNRIRSMGLCGIGPAGFFDLATTLEVITIENLTIAANTIQNTLIGNLKPLSSSNFGYGAICVPDVLNLIVRDNTVTSFGARPGLVVCGIYVLHGEVIEISRNQVIDNRDWPSASTVEESANTVRGGIVVALAEPPSFSAPVDAYLTAAATAPIFEPGLPALRVEHNVVRVPLSYSLAAAGFGPFSIVNNHLGCGGTVKSAGVTIAETVFIVNLGRELEAMTSASSYTEMRDSAGAVDYSGFSGKAQSLSTSGAVLFTNNICHLERWAGGQRGLANVAILTLDHLTFSNNHCWIDGPELSVFVDAMLFAATIQVNSNRFQESAGFPVLFSGITYGLVNITSQNISTYCLWTTGTAANGSNNNIALISVAATALNQADPCASLQQPT